MRKKILSARCMKVLFVSEWELGKSESYCGKRRERKKEMNNRCSKECNCKRDGDKERVIVIAVKVSEREGENKK